MALPLDPSYGITISLQSVAYKPEFIHNEVIKYIDPVLRRIFKYYYIIPEFSKKGRLHYHGIGTGYDHIKAFQTKYKLDKIGLTKFDELKTIKDKMRWILYIHKEMDTTMRVFKYEDIKELHNFKKNLKKQKSEIKEIKTHTIYDYLT